MLALVSVGVAVVTYRFVAGHLAVDHLNREAGRYAAILEYRAQDEGIETPEQLAALLSDVRRESTSEVAWLRVLDREGNAIARYGDSPLRETFDAQSIRDVLEMRRRNVVTEISTPGGQVMVAVLPFRFQLGDEIRSRSAMPAFGGQQRFKLIEVALYLTGATDAFLPLKRNLIVGIAAPLALLLSLVVMTLLFPSFLRGREFEQQLALARRVQQQLLPEDHPDSGDLEVISEFLPFWGVGGDYYDVFSTGSARTFVVLGDVSGKGLPAALIMGMVHGSVRSAARAWDGIDHGRLAAELNELLYTNTAANRFVTLFWACYQPDEGCLRFINAGHNPPLLVRRRPTGLPTIEAIPPSGPVLGVLPGATYTPGTASFRPDDLLVLYSDGVVEATNSDDAEFGDERLEEILTQHADLSPVELKQEVLGQLRDFLGREELQDDLTLLIVRIAPGESSD